MARRSQRIFEFVTSPIYLLSKEGQQLILKGGLWSPRADVGMLEQKFKKSYLDEKYSLEEIEAKYAQ